MAKTFKSTADGNTVTYGIAPVDAALPLNPQQAEDWMDSNGNLTLTLLLDQENYMRHVVASATDGSTTPEIYAHSAAYSFGRPFESSAEIVGTSGPDFVISYSTHIREFLAGDDVFR